MSRVGKKPIQVPNKVTISYKDRHISVKGEKGQLERTIHPAVDLNLQDGVITVDIVDNKTSNNAIQGLTRSLVSNMITGVHNGFERILEINGIGYRAEVKGKTLVLNLGFSKPVNFDLPDGVNAEVEKNTVVKLSGIDFELLGQTAAAIRRLRPPEPYKGKGIKYAGENIQRKAGKTGTK